MFGIAFDLKVYDAEMSHPKGATQAYADIRAFLVEQWSDFTGLIKS